MLRETDHLVVLDVPDVAADCVVDSLVHPEELPAFAASSDLILPVDSDAFDPDSGGCFCIIHSGPQKVISRCEIWKDRFFEK